MDSETVKVKGVDFGKLSMDQVVTAFAIVWGVLELIEDMPGPPRSRNLKDARAFVEYMCREISKERGSEISEVRVSLSAEDVWH